MSPEIDQNISVLIGLLQLLLNEAVVAGDQRLIEYVLVQSFSKI
jgi:hypothetical protein